MSRAVVQKLVVRLHAPILLGSRVLLTNQKPENDPPASHSCPIPLTHLPKAEAVGTKDDRPRPTERTVRQAASADLCWGREYYGPDLCRSGGRREGSQEEKQARRGRAAVDARNRGLSGLYRPRIFLGHVGGADHPLCQVCDGRFDPNGRGCRYHDGNRRGAGTGHRICVEANVSAVRQDFRKPPRPSVSSR